MNEAISTVPTVQEAPQLVGIERMMEIVWPDPKNRPSERTVREAQKNKAIPFMRLGRLIYFDPQLVRLALQSQPSAKFGFKN